MNSPAKDKRFVFCGYFRHTLSTEMRKLKAHRLLRSVVVLGMILALGSIAQVSAQMVSPNYSVNEAQFGSGSSLEQCSTTYCSNASVGDLTVGGANSTTYSAQTGFNTAAEPLLEVSSIQGSQNAGVLDTTTTGKVSGVIKVRSYLTNGYVLQVAGSPPKMGSHPLTAMTTLAASTPGTEQFGINLAANTSPSVGAVPLQVPDSTFSFGTVATGYNTTNQFKYVNGDIVARSLTSSGETDYTISMILNISNVTPGGQYVGSFSAVVVPVY